MTSTTESQKSKQKSQPLTLNSNPDDRIATEIAEGTMSLGDLLALEEEDMRLQYKHLNIR